MIKKSVRYVDMANDEVNNYIEELHRATGVPMNREEVFDIYRNSWFYKYTYKEDRIKIGDYIRERDKMNETA